MTRIAPLLLKKEQSNVKRFRAAMQVNNEKIISLDVKVKELKASQQKFATVLHQPVRPVTLHTVQQAIRKLSHESKDLKAQIIQVRSAQDVLQTNVTIADSRIEKLQTGLLLQRAREKDSKDQVEIEELSLLSRFEGVNGASAPSGFQQGMTSLPVQSDSVKKLPHQMPLAMQYESINVNGTLRLNESQSVSVNIEAHHNNDCSVVIHAPEGVTQTLLHRSKDELEQQIVQQGLHVSDLKIEKEPAG